MTSWILLEHEADLQDMMLTMVQILGDEGVAFSDGEDAIEWIAAFEQGRISVQKPELALLDIGNRLERGGTAVAERLRASSRLKHIIIVLMTSRRLRFEDEEAVVEDAGANFVLYKPLPSTDELELILHGLLLSR
jgi:CheY-like chemotaxis protein